MKDLWGRLTIRVHRCFSVILLALLPLSGCHFLAPESVAPADVSCTCSYPDPAPDRTEEQLQELVVGRWEWECTQIMDRGVQPSDNVIHADSADYTMQREFLPDGRVLYYRNGILESEHTYEVRKTKILEEDEAAVEILYIDGAGMFMYASEDTLMYGNGASDGFDSKFVRTK